MKKHELRFQRLGKYTVFATAFLASQQADTQVVYTDVDPDVVLNPNEFGTIDLDNDGSLDFDLVNLNDSFATALGIGIYDSQAVAGYMLDFFGTSFAMASMFDAGEPIGPSLNWMTQTNSGNGFWGSLMGFGDFGQWDNVTNKFAGLRIRIGGNDHYGWARFDVTHTKLTLKDYAYNDTPNASINADLVGIQSAQQQFTPTVYSNNDFLQIELPSNISSADVVVFDMNGRLLSNEHISSSATIQMGEYPQGIYLVKIASGEMSYSTLFSKK
ncbi:MAG: T9SS type A sorting domain-containing protein [Chitinophagales bacterium]